MSFMIETRVYLKPLAPGGLDDDLPLAKILQAGKQSLLRRLRGKLLQQTAFTPRAKAALSKSIQVVVKESSLQIGSSHPAFLPLIRGQKRQQMRWLTKARAPIPIFLDDGRLIFRSATRASMGRGAWWHPGRAPTNYVDKAKALTRKFMRERITEEMEKLRQTRMSHLPSKMIRSR
jgi:hypothetical protein